MRPRHLVLTLLVGSSSGLLACLAGCDSSQPTQAGPAPQPPAPATNVAASVAPVAPAAPRPDEPSEPQPPSPKAPPTHTYSCGGEGLPKCPLQKWMAENLQPAMKANDPVKLALALRQAAKLGPKSGYPLWAKFAIDGAEAIEKAKDVKAGKPSCADCHGEYKQKYKLEDRDRAL